MPKILKDNIQIPSATSVGDILLITDVDGTLLNDQHEISEENINAINAFREAGGMFTIATGRGVAMARLITKKLDIKCPGIIFNGAAIHDFGENKQLWCCSLNPETKRYLEIIMEKFPTCAIEILRGDNVYLLCSNELEEYHLKFGKVTPIRTTLEKVPADGWLKALLVDEPENIDKIIDFTEKNCGEFTCWVRSSPVYYEMLPENVNKGSGMLKMFEFIGHNKFTIAAGDFMNDLELLKYADIGIAVDNAEETVKAVSDMIVTNNNNHAVAEIIEYILNSCRGEE